MRDAVATMGDILPDDVRGRDAVHVAVVSAVAAERLAPGQDVGMANAIEDGRASGNVKDKIGIVDPFLRGAVTPGQRFWLFLYPRSITGLSHVWAHPAFSEVKAAQSEAWLRNFCDTADCPGYEAVMKLIRDGDWGDGYDNGRIDEEYLHFGGSDAHGEIPDEFWVHVENVLGHAPRAKPKYFSCSC